MPWPPRSATASPGISGGISVPVPRNNEPSRAFRMWNQLRLVDTDPAPFDPTLVISPQKPNHAVELFGGVEQHWKTFTQSRKGAHLCFIWFFVDRRLAAKADHGGLRRANGV